MSAYETEIRDATMKLDKCRMMGVLSHAMVQAGGGGLLPDRVVAFIESCARNGIELMAVVSKDGPYSQKLNDDGSRNYS